MSAENHLEKKDNENKFYSLDESPLPPGNIEKHFERGKKAFEDLKNLEILRENKKIIAYNLKMFKTDMNDLLMKESFGGNAGSIEVNGKKYSCAAANGYANSKTGEIVAFGNSQDIDPKISKNNVQITLRISSFDGKIVDFYGKEKIMKGSENIEKAIEEYNLNVGQKLEE